MLTTPSKEPTFALSPIKAIELAASKLSGVISLAQGIPSFRTPRVIIDFVQERIESGACDKYSLTTGLAELREEIALSLNEEGLRYDPDSEIIVTAGSIEGIAAALLSHISPGDEVIIPSPTYTSYQNCIRLAGGIPHFVELDEERNFDLDLNAIEQAINRKTRAIFYCNPNNPTGTIFSEQATLDLLQLAERHNLILITDEVYKDFYYTDDIHCTPARFAGGKERVIRICSFSKAFAMTGWRVGFMHASKERIRRIIGYHDALVTCAPVVSQYAAIAAIRYGSEALAEFRNEFNTRRNFAINILDQMSHILDYQLPKASYFVFPRIKDSVPLSSDSTKLAYDILEKARVAVVPGVAFGPSGESHLRINFGRTAEDLETGMQRLAEYFTKQTSERRRQSTELSEKPVADQGAKPRSIGRYRSLIQKILTLGAQTRLRRGQPTIVGVVGLRGKSTVKRSVASLLSKNYRTRAGIRSYNTAFGLPLSILNLKTPRQVEEKLSFTWRFAKRVLIDRDFSEVLVLEYGIHSRADALELLAIARPDWLIITDLAVDDPEIDRGSVIEGLEAFIAELDRDQIFWVRSKYVSDDLAGRLSPALAIDPDQPVGQALEPYQEGLSLPIEPVGKSAKTGLISAVALATKLHVPPTSIAQWLKEQARLI